MACFWPAASRALAQNTVCFVELSEFEPPINHLNKKTPKGGFYLNGGGCSLPIKVLRGNHGLSAKIQGILIIFADYKMTLT